MAATERTVLHVLPHPGGGGERYVDLLDEMPGYRFSRVHLARNPSPALWELARGVVRAIRSVRGHDVVHVHGEVAAGLCLSLLATHPSVVTLHGLHLVRRLSGLRRKVAVLNLRAVLRAADGTICVSQAEHDELLRIVGRSAAKRAVVIHNGVHLPPQRSGTDRSAIRAELGIPEHEVVGIWVGSLDERKDPLTAVRAANRSEVTLLVVGDGPLRSQVEEAASEQVHVLGQRSDVSRLLAAADVYILTSRREGLAVSLLEAMAVALPAVVTDLPENVEAIGEACVQVSVGDEEGLIAALSRLGENESERNALGRLARQRVVEFFDAEEMTDRTRAFYDGVIAERQPASRPRPTAR